MSVGIRRAFALLIIGLVVLAFSGQTAAADELRLSERQRSQLRELASDMKAETYKLRKKLFEERRELGRLYSSYNLDDKRVRAQIDQISSIQYALLNVGLDNQIRLRKIVSPQQFQVLTKMQKERVGKFKDRKGDRRGLHEPKHMEDVGKALIRTDITSDQKDKLGKLYHKTTMSSGRELAEASRVVERLYNNYNLNEREARLAVKRVNQAQRSLMMANLSRQKELRKILTEEQFKAVHAKLMRYERDTDR